MGTKKIAKKKLTRRKRIALLVLKLTLGIFLIACVSACGWFGIKRLQKMDFFTIRKVEVKTDGKVKREELLTLSGIKEGKNIFDFRMKEAISSIEYHPWVKKVSIMRRLPDQVVIEVIERKPVALVVLGEIYYLDQDLEVFKKVLPGEDVDFPIFSGLSEKELLEDKTKAKEKFKMGMEILELVQGSHIFDPKDVSELHWEEFWGFDLIFRHGLVVRFGKENYREKWNKVEMLFAELGDKATKLSFLEVENSGRIVARVRSGYQLARQDEIKEQARGN